jgi:hypothetical protein
VQPEPLKPRSRARVRLVSPFVYLVFGLLALLTVMVLRVNPMTKEIHVGPMLTRADSATEAARICKIVVQDKLDRGRLITSTAATFAPFTMKRNDLTGYYEGRGEVTALGRSPVTDQFVCFVHWISGIGGVLRSQDPEMYAKLVTTFGL